MSDAETVTIFLILIAWNVALVFAHLLNKGRIENLRDRVTDHAHALSAIDDERSMRRRAVKVCEPLNSYWPEIPKPASKPLKSRAWVVWRKDGTPAGVWLNREHAAQHKNKYLSGQGATIQEIERP